MQQMSMNIGKSVRRRLFSEEARLPQRNCTSTPCQFNSKQLLLLLLLQVVSTKNRLKRLETGDSHYASSKLTGNATSGLEEPRILTISRFLGCSVLKVFWGLRFFYINFIFCKALQAQPIRCSHQTRVRNQLPTKIRQKIVDLVKLTSKTTYTLRLTTTVFKE